MDMLSAVEGVCAGDIATVLYRLPFEIFARQGNVCHDLTEMLDGILHGVDWRHQDLFSVMSSAH